MIAVMASSKLNGQSETGFAFGIGPPMANGVEHFSPDTSSEPAVPVACSAACYDRREDVRILAVVMTEREFSQVQRQVGLAHVVIGAHHATLEQAPKAVQVGGMDIPAHIFTLGMVHGLMRVFPIQFAISRPFIGCDKRHAGINCLSHKLAQGMAVSAFNDLTHYVPLAGNRANDANLVAVGA